MFSCILAHLFLNCHLQDLAADDAPSVCLCFWNPYGCLCGVWDDWRTSRTLSSSRTQKAPVYREPSFNAHHTRMGNIWEMGTRTQSVIDLPHSIHPITRIDSDIMHANALGTSIIILNSYQVANDLLVKRSSIYSSR